MSENFNGTVSIAPTGSSQSTITLNAGNGDVVMGNNGRDGDLLLQDGSGNERVHISADGNRIEVQNSAEQITAMLGGSGNLRAGSNGEDGDLFLYRASATNIFSNSQWSVRLSANDGRLEIRNAGGEIICMLGANGNLRLGSNGSDGDILMFRSNASSLFTNADATVNINAEAGDMTLGGSGVNGDMFLRDTNGNTRLRLLPGSERMEVLNGSGQIIGMLGANGNLRLGTNGTDGDILLYPSSGNDIFSDGAASIHLDANAGDITLRNADCAEEFDIGSAEPVEAGTVMSLGSDGRLIPSDNAHDTTVIGVVSGAGCYKAGILLDRQPGLACRQPIALMGKTFVQVTDEGGPIAIGDLLTSSSTPGKAMRVSDRTRALGTVIGKAIGRHDKGEGLIPMVITLQ